MKRLHRAGRRLTVLLAFAVALAAPAAWGQGAGGGTDIFTVADVPVDATAASAAAARDAARLDGQRRALQTLLQRLTLAADHNRLPHPSDARITDMIRDFSVANERRSTVRYLADYTFRFRPDQVRGLLRSAGIPFAETVSKPVTVLPVLTAGAAGPVLWDDPNPWRDAWANRNSSQPSPAGGGGQGGGLVPLVVPLGDAADVAAIDAQKALAGDPDALAAITRRYGGGDALVAAATLAADGTLAISAKRISPTGTTAIPAAILKPAPGESEADLMARGVAQTVAAVEEAWKRGTLLGGGPEAVLTASVPISSLADWLAIRDRLASLAIVKRSDLLSLDRHAAEVELHYFGDPAKLGVALAQRDLVLSQGAPSQGAAAASGSAGQNPGQIPGQAGAEWTLQRRGSAAPAQ
jgi:hypothetical protein